MSIPTSPTTLLLVQKVSVSAAAVDVDPVPSKWLVKKDVFIKSLSGKISRRIVEGNHKYSATSIFLYTLEATTGDPRWCILFSAAFVYFFGVTIATIICDEGSKEHACSATP